MTYLVPFSNPRNSVRFLVTHGGVADYALVAEGTGFGLVWIEAGKFWFKVTLTSDQPPFYTPYLPDRTTMAKSPSMVVAGAAAIEALERWATDYQKRNVYKSAGGTIVPKVQVGAIRSGDIYRPYLAPQVCHLYLDVRSVPGQDPLATREEIKQVLAGVGLNASVQLYHFRPGYEAKNIDRLAQAVTNAPRLMVANPFAFAPGDSATAVRIGTAMRQEMKDMAGRNYVVVEQTQMNAFIGPLLERTE